MLRPGDVRPGDPSTRLTAAGYNEAADAIRRALALRVVPPLTLRGRTLCLERGEGFWATLSGASSPYSFAEAADTPTVGTWAAMPRAGTANAYEANGVAGLDGKRVLLRPGAPGDYRFQWVASGSGGDPPGGCGCFAEGDIPPTLSWTYVSRRWDDFSGTVITLGTTSGTLTYNDPNSYDGCGLGAAWVGEFEYYTEGVPPDTGISSLLIEHCSTQLPGGQAGTRRCLWLALTCESMDANAGVGGAYGDIGIGQPSNLFFAGKIDGNPSCLLYNAGASSMDGFPGHYYPQDGSAGRVGVSLSELCEDGAIYVAYPDSISPTYDSGLGYYPWRSYSLLTITL